MRFRKGLLTITLLALSGSGCAKFESDSMALALLAGQVAAQTTAYTVGVSVSGLTGGTLSLTNNTSDQLTITADGDATFPTTLVDGAAYEVAVSSQPTSPAHTCSVDNGSGTISTANINGISITCVLGRLLGGTIHGTLTFSGTPEVSTTAGDGTNAVMEKPKAITTDGTYLYVADTDNHRILKVTIADGTISTLAGSGTSGSANGTGVAATFKKPEGITTDGTNVYVADKDNHLIRQIVISTGVVTTLAGNDGTSGTTDATGTVAEFNKPRGLTTDGTNLYVSDTDNHRIRKIVIATGVVTTLAGNGSGYNDDTGTAALFDKPHKITMDASNLYVADKNNGQVRKIVIATGVVTTLVAMNKVTGITTDGTNLYLTSKDDDLVRKYDALIAGGTLSTIVGAAGGGAFADGDAVTTALIWEPEAITSDGTSLYFADAKNNRIRKYY